MIRKIMPYIIVFIFLTLLFSCSDYNVEINGHLTEGKNQWIWLYEITPQKLIPFDSIQIDEHDNFSIKGIIKDPTFIRLKSEKGEYIFFIVEPKDEISIEGNYNKLQSSYTIKGSYESSILREYLKQFDFALKEKRRIANSYHARIDAGENIEIVRQESIERHQKMKSEIRSFTMNFLMKNKCSLASVFILDMQLGPKDPILTMGNDYKYFAMVDSCLTIRYPKLEIVQEFNKTLIFFHENKKNINDLKLMIGNSAPDIALPNPNGDTILLSSLKGKYVLLDFWASWNKECRKNNIQFLKLYHQYNKKGFDIYQVSLDKSKEAWIKAINADKLPWVQVSDLMFWDSYVINLFGIYSIPANFLINPSGVIMDINMEPDRLDKKLSTIFK